MRALRVLFPFALAACAFGGDTDSSLEQALGGTSNVKLKRSSAHMKLTDVTSWTLDKQGTVNPATQTASWTITATQGATTTGVLIVYGTFTVKNDGNGGAPIGNVVVNLQTRSGNTWVTKSSDIADATQDDAATSANVVSWASSEGKSMFTENAASGALSFMDAKTNTAFALVPQVTIPPHSTKTLLFSATFNNNVLNLPPGKSTRVEVIVSFGNANSGSSTKPNIDINGNGIVDPEESRVRSVATRLGLTVPHHKPSNPTVVLSDALSDITTTGTVTFSNPQIVLGTTTGTVTVRYDGGTSGGTITNCAHLRSQTENTHCGGHTFITPGIDLTDCDTLVIGAHSCTPGTVGCGWEQGDVVTHTQVAWGTPASPAATLLSSQFFNVFPAGFVEIGLAGAAGFSAIFTAPSSIITYLPASGTLGPLTADLIDPSSTSSGAFGGEVLGLALNVAFSSLTGGTSGVQFGSLTLCGVTPASLNGTSVNALLASANTLLGGGTNAFTINDLAPIAAELNNAFSGGAPSTWAQDHLFNGACPP
ncbi:MAG TPA: hypothetical protein VIV11_23515 [Kofleriaceae bacterium]